MTRKARQPAASETALPRGFAAAVVDWQATHGRHSLPWQNTRDPYRVWLSEIMLQQTQVATVLDYYARFLDRFPTVSDLALAQEDEVLALWSGLGYYSRARNLHRCAQQVLALHGGEFPRSAEQLQTLPGIGPSTAAAVASFCFSERVAILDGNVKRVLTRVLAFGGDLSAGASERALWAMANELLPDAHLQERMPRYTQGMMDLGATVCIRRQPRCEVCPLRAMCLGLAGGEPEKYPVKTRKLKRSSLKLSLLWARRADGAVWLERRPGNGIWGGLYCLPVFESEDALQVLLEQLPKAAREGTIHLQPFLHVLTHKDLHLHPVAVTLENPSALALGKHRADSAGKWFASTDWPALGLPTPIRKLLAGENRQAQLSL